MAMIRRGMKFHGKKLIITGMDSKGGIGRLFLGGDSTVVQFSNLCPVKK